MAGRSRSAGAGPAGDEAAHTAHGWSLCGSGGLRSGLQRHWQSMHDGHGSGGSGLARGLQDNLRRAAPCSAPGRPKRSTGAPPGSGPRAATRSGPTRPGPASASAAPPARARPLPARRGGGVRGASPPRGADTRRHPTSRVSAGAHAGAARRRAGPLPPSRGDCVSDGSVGGGFGGRAGHPLPEPGPRGQRQLVIVRAQRAKARRGGPSPSLL